MNPKIEIQRLASLTAATVNVYARRSITGPIINFDNRANRVYLTLCTANMVTQAAARIATCLSM